SQSSVARMLHPAATQLGRQPSGKVAVSPSLPHRHLDLTDRNFETRPGATHDALPPLSLFAPTPPRPPPPRRNAAPPAHRPPPAPSRPPHPTRPASAVAKRSRARVPLVSGSTSWKTAPCQPRPTWRPLSPFPKLLPLKRLKGVGEVASSEMAA